MQKAGTFVTRMPSSVARSTGMLSTPIPKRDTTTQRGAVSSASVGIRLQFVRIASAWGASAISSSASPVSATSRLGVDAREDLALDLERRPGEVGDEDCEATHYERSGSRGGAANAA